VARAKREYRVLLAATFSKEVRVMATSAKKAARIVYDDPEVDQLGGIFFTEEVGRERVLDVVRASEEWHHERTAEPDVEGSER
jgi:hypothetical protein